MNEKLETNPEKLVRLETLGRNLVQAELIKIMLGESSNLKDQLNWVSHYSELVSEIIDNPANETLRDLIVKREYDQAAHIVRDTLNAIEHQSNRAA